MGDVQKTAASSRNWGISAFRLLESLPVFSLEMHLGFFCLRNRGDLPLTKGSLGAFLKKAPVLFCMSSKEKDIVAISGVSIWSFARITLYPKTGIP